MGSGGGLGPVHRGGTCLSGMTGKWETVYGLFRRWQRDGTWAQILAELQTRADVEGLITGEANVDSTSCGRISMRPVPAKGDLQKSHPAA